MRRRRNGEPDEKYVLAFRRLAVERLEAGAKRYPEGSIFDRDNLREEYEEIADAYNYLNTRILDGQGDAEDKTCLILYEWRGAKLAEKIEKQGGKDEEE